MKDEIRAGHHRKTWLSVRPPSSAPGTCICRCDKARRRGQYLSFTLVTGVNLQGLGSCSIYGYQTQQVGFACVTSKHTALQYSLLLSHRIISPTEISSRFSFCFCFAVFSLLSLSWKKRLVRSQCESPLLTKYYETWYVYHGTWTHLYCVLHKSLLSVCVSINVTPHRC
jgi:hypothetical protein